MNKKKVKFLIGIVLYKEKVSGSSTIISLLSIAEHLNKEEAIIAIWDNSPEIQTKDELKVLEKFSNISYQHTHENISLSKIYNSFYTNHKKFNFLVLFDQDSRFDINYFLKIKTAGLENPFINLFLPIIKVGSQIVSPADRYYVSGRYWKIEKIGLVKTNKKLAITSGMVISKEYLINNYPCFNEDLNLYGIDTDFMIQYEKKNEYFFVISYVMEHNLSFFENETIEKKYLRFKDHKNSLLKIFKKESNQQYYLVKILLFLSKFKMAAKYRSLIFLK